MISPYITRKNVRDTNDMSEREIFLEELKHPGFIGLHNACEQFKVQHGHSLIDLEIQIYIDRDKTFKVLVIADNHGILLVTKGILRNMIKDNIGAMVHIASIPSLDRSTNLYTLSYYIELK